MNLPRSYLFVPGDRPERFDKAAASGADVVVLDLEDAVAPERKALAREAIAAWLIPARADCVAVRINDAAAAEFHADLAMLAAAGATHVMLPKAESAAQVASVCAALPGARMLALIESAKGVVAVNEVAAAPGVTRLVFGTLDFALDLGIAPEPAGLAHAAASIALASAAAGLAAPVAGVTPAIHDEALLLADFAWARSLGFGAKLCIHPKQIVPLHDALRPTEAELAWASHVIAAAQTAQGAAVQVDGRMVDRPVLQRALSMQARVRR
jgi:citrate lyase subunit beta/citryl-CoA lyase